MQFNAPYLLPSPGPDFTTDLKIREELPAPIFHQTGTISGSWIRPITTPKCRHNKWPKRLKQPGAKYIFSRLFITNSSEPGGQPDRGRQPCGLLEETCVTGAMCCNDRCEECSTNNHKLKTSIYKDHLSASPPSPIKTTNIKRICPSEPPNLLRHHHAGMRNKTFLKKPACCL